MSGGAGADEFWLTRGTVTHPNYPNGDYGSVRLTITDADATDKLYWNGYQLTGGSIAIIDEQHYGDPTGQPPPFDYEQGSSFWADYLGDHGIFYDFVPEWGPDLYIYLPTNEQIVVQNFTNGMLGINLIGDYPMDGYLDGYAGVPRSNIADNGTFFDFDGLAGRAQALATAGPIADYFALT